MPSLHRRDLMLGAAALAGLRPAEAQIQAPQAHVSQAQVSQAQVSQAQVSMPETIRLWPGKPPGGPGPGGVEQVTPTGAVANITVPRMIMQRPYKPNGAAVLILGGGGYRRIGIAKESQPTADWLLTFGVTTFILYYRLPNAGWPAVVPFQDAQRALRLIRSRADALGLDESQIGIIGYSAGGHCAGMTSMRPDAPLYTAVDDADTLSARPDFAGLIYPVLTMLPPNQTRISTATLLGPNPPLEAMRANSIDLLVTDDAPTTFLAHATDDPIAPVENSLLMFSALRRSHVPVEMHVFRSGGHGFNLGKRGDEDHAWPRLFATWAGFEQTAL